MVGATPLSRVQGNQSGVTNKQMSENNTLSRGYKKKIEINIVIKNFTKVSSSQMNEVGEQHPTCTALSAAPLMKESKHGRLNYVKGTSIVTLQPRSP